MRHLSYALACVFLSGCAGGMSSEECLSADWYAIGYEDGARGATVSAVTPRRQACAKKAGVTIDMASYLDGREEGLTHYCTPANGYAVGSRGANYYGVCDGPREAQFLEAFETGRYLFSLEQAVASASAAIQQAHHDLNEVEHQIAHTETAIISPDTPHPERVLLLSDLRDLSKEKGRIETAIIALNRDHALAVEELEDYRAHLAFNGPYPQSASRAQKVNY
jgi:hypothetical protein